MNRRRMAFITMGSWFCTFQRPHHFASNWREFFNICVINHKAMLAPDDAYSAEERDIVDSILNVYSLRGGGRLPFINDVNEKIRGYQYKRRFGSDPFRGAEVVYTWNVQNLDYLGYCGDKVLIYDAMDDWAAFDGAATDEITENERRVAGRADIVLAVSDKIYDRLVRVNPNTHLLRNGVDAEYFGSAQDYKKSEADILYKHRDKKLVGYVGHISTWVDIDLIIETAKILDPCVFVVIGPIKKSLANKFDGIKNILYLGPKPYSELVSYISYFDAGIIPFKMNLLNESTNPIKMYEYLGAGLPVVSTGMQEVAKYEKEGVVYIGNTPEEFSAKILEALKTSSDEELAAERMRIARDNSWHSKADFVLHLIENARR